MSQTEQVDDERAGEVADAGDDVSVVDDNGVLTTTAAEDTLPGEFLERLAGTVAPHRVWQRETAAIPA